MTNAISLFEKIAEKAEQDRQLAERQWQTIVERLAVNEPTTEDEVLAVLRLVGRTLQQLAEAVDWQKHILDLRSVVNEWPAVEKAAQLVHETVTEFHSRRQRHEQTMILECRAITVRQQESAAELQRIVAARDELSALLDSPVAWPEVVEVVG